MKLNTATTEGVKQVEAKGVFEDLGRKWFYTEKNGLITIYDYETGMQAIRPVKNMFKARSNLATNITLAPPNSFVDAMVTLKENNIPYPVNK